MVIARVKKVILNKPNTNTSDLRKEIRKYQKLKKQISDEFEPVNVDKQETTDTEGFGTKLAKFIGQASKNLEETQNERQKKEKHIKDKNNIFDEINSGKFF